MNTYEQILVVFLSTTLLILLVLCIFLVVKVIKLANRVDRISEKVETGANKFVTFGESLQRFTGPIVMGRVMTSIFKSNKSKAKKG